MPAKKPQDVTAFQNPMATEEVSGDDVEGGNAARKALRPEASEDYMQYGCVYN